MKPLVIKTVNIACIIFISTLSALSQTAYTLQQCLEYAVENNRNLKKAHYDQEKATFARQEVLGTLLPQISGSASLNDNLKRSKFIMPNFINSMLPPAAQDPNAEKYMTIEMGMTFNANVGVSLNQQILNFSLFNTLEIAKTAEKMAALGVESNEEDIIYQTANLFYAIQSTEYAVVQMEKSIELVSKMLSTMEVNYKNGLVKKIDVDRLKVNLVNLTTQKGSIKNAADVQKNLLKLQMGFDVNNPIDIQEVNLALFEEKATINANMSFFIENQTPYRLLMKKMDMVKLQRKSAVYENLPTLALILNYQYNGVSDEFFRGETNYWYPTSVVGLNLRVPIFSGLSRKAKIHQNSIEVQKTEEDAKILEQSLSVAYLNARTKLNDAHNTIALQRDNQKLAEDVFNVAENNFVLGLSSMSDILNVSQSLVQAQLSYANALNDYMKAFIDLKKANGDIHSLTNENN
ncbi:MAG: transporter [Bacteroidales bacterium 36-12]|nr:MAG: transporter [Bacteroidales bacterium 36-12]